MTFLGNLLWFIFGGFINWLVWSFFGLLWCITIIGIPVGMQCFKMARLSAWPFGKKVIYSSKFSSLAFNILWLIFGGLEIAIAQIISGIFLCITIIGIPFGKQQFKLALLALMPFGSEVVKSNETFWGHYTPLLDSFIA